MSRKHKTLRLDDDLWTEILAIQSAQDVQPTITATLERLLTLGIDQYYRDLEKKMKKVRF